MAIFDRLRQSPNKIEKDDPPSNPSSESSASDRIEQVKLLEASTRGSVHSDSGISCTTTTSSRLRPPRGEEEIRLINKLYDTRDETSSIRSHNTSRSNSTFRSGDISASVSTFKPFLMSNGVGVDSLTSEDDTTNPFERFVEVLLSTHMPATNGKTDHLTNGKHHVTNGKDHVTNGKDHVTNGKDRVTNGFQDDSHLWAIFSSSRLNLKIPPDQVRTMRDWFYASADRSETESLTCDFVRSIRDLITQLSRERPLYGPSWIAIIDHKSRELFFNRVTGEARYALPNDFPTLSDMDVFGRTIHEMFYSVTKRGSNHITLTQFDEICASKKYNFDLKQEERTKLLRAIIKTVDDEEVIFYEDFVPVGRALLLKWYRQQYPKGGDWLKLSSKRYGFFYLNKMTGETTFRPAQYEREQLSLYLQETLKEVDVLREAVKVSEEERESTNARLDHMTAECAGQSNEVTELSARVAEMEEQLKKQKEEEQELLQKMEKTSGQLEALQEELAAVQQARDSLQSEKDTLKQDLEARVQALETELEKKQKTIESLMSDADSLRDEIAKSNAVANAKTSEAAGLLYDYDEEKSAHTATEERFKEAKQQLENEIAELQLKLSASEENNRNLLATGGKLQTSINELNSEQTALRLTVTDLETKLQEEERTNDELRAITQSQDNKNALMDADLKTFKEEQMTAKNKEIAEALKLIESLKAQLEYQQEEVRTLKIKYSSKSQVFAQQSEDVYKLKEELSVLQERDAKHAEVLAEAVAKAGKIIRKAHSRENTAVSLTRVNSCPELDQPFPSGPTIEPTQKRKVKQCWGSSAPRPQNICQAFTEPGDVALCTREREKVIITRDQEKVEVKSLRAPRDDSYIHHTRPFSPTCTCNGCRKLVGGRPKSAVTRNPSPPEGASVHLGVGDRVRCRTIRPGYKENRICEGVIEYIGRRRDAGKTIYVGVNLGLALGDTDGFVDGERLFRCLPKHGIVVPLHNVLAYFSLKTQSFVPLVLQPPNGEKKAGRRRPKSANNVISPRNGFSSINVDERFIRSPYLQSLIAVDIPTSASDFKGVRSFTKPRISRPISRQRTKNRPIAYD